MKINNWSAHRVVDERSRETKLLIEGPRNLGGGFIAVGKFDLAEKPEKLRKVLLSKGAHLTGTTEQQMLCIEKVLSDMSRQTLVLAMKPGWRDDGFVLGRNMIGKASGKYRWLQGGDDAAIGDTAGTLEGWKAEVGSVAAQSSYLAMSVMVALGASLPGYINRHVKNGVKGLRPLIMETAVFNTSGGSGTGKSSTGRCCASVVGSPDAISKWDFTRRGLEELCEGHNDLVLVLDDTEKLVELDMSLKTAMRLVGQTVTSGQSKAIAGVARQKDLPELRWSTFGMSSSPLPIDTMGAKVGLNRSLGEKVRFVDIPLPSAEKCGIFDRMSSDSKDRLGAAKQLINRLEAGVVQHHGHLMPAWIEMLIAKDVSLRVQEYCDYFVAKVVGRGTGYDERFARKFAVPYAAGRIAVEDGLLNWSPDLPMKAARRCYNRALPSVVPDEVRATQKIVELAGLQKIPARFPKATGGTTVKFGTKTLGIRTVLKGKNVCAIRDDNLLAFAGSPAVAKEMRYQLDQAGALGSGHGSAGTAQLAVPLEIDGSIINKPRFWIISSLKLKKHLPR